MTNEYKINPDEKGEIEECRLAFQKLIDELRNKGYEPQAISAAAYSMALYSLVFLDGSHERIAIFLKHQGSDINIKQSLELLSKTRELMKKKAQESK